MSIIRRLPESVANQIAAGEVVQNPSNVVKELVENAIDAGATKVRVMVRNGGKTLVQVIDDGCGMSPDDAKLAFERHATSKIQDARDLYDLHTMGFRGEALATIASVAQVEMITKTAEAQLATRVCIEGNEITEFGEQTGVKGTQFLVKNLFYNIPARRRFLKDDAKELREVVKIFLRIALAYPQVGMQLHNGAQPLYCFESTNLRGRVLQVAGKQLGQQLLPVEFDTDLLKITGFVGKAEAARKTSGNQYFFVNNRYMHSPYFNKAVEMCYDKVIADGMKPTYYIYFDIDPQFIDVNVHPQKTQIKFDDEQGVYQMLSSAVHSVLGKYQVMPPLDFTNDELIELPNVDSTIDVQKVISDLNMEGAPIYNPFEQEKGAQRGGSEPYIPTGFTSQQPRPAAQWNAGRDKVETYGQLYKPSGVSGGGSYQSALRNMDFGSDADSDRGAAEQLAADNTTISSSLVQQPLFELETTEDVPLFQLDGRYIIRATKGGVMAIDQHRAHYLIQYSRFIDIVGKKRNDGAGNCMAGQVLLFPEEMSLTAEEACIFAELEEELRTVGLVAEYKPEQGILQITQVPAVLESREVHGFVQGLIAACHDGEVDVWNNVNANICRQLALHSATPYGRLLSPEEMKHICKQLFELPNPQLAPNGKPVFQFMPVSF